MLGAEVITVNAGTRTLKDAINEALRDWVTNVQDTYYLLGSALGPHPYPLMVRDFQSVIGREAREQILSATGKLPRAVMACVGGGSNAIGLFHPFIGDGGVRLIGVEAGGCGDSLGKHAARFHSGKKSGGGRVGVLQGTMSYVLQDTNGQIATTHSISAGLDYSAIGPEHAFLHDSGRAEYTSASDAEALEGLRLCAKLEGIIPALETAHAILPAIRLARELPPDDAHHRESLRARRQGRSARGRVAAPMSRIREKFGELKRSGRGGFIPFITAGDPDLATTERLLIELAHRGADIIELGVPFSDPVADGEVIQRASERALRSDVTVRDAFTCVRNVRQRIDVPIVLFSYFNPLLQFGPGPFASAAREAGIDGVLVTDLIPEEAESWTQNLLQHGLDPIFLVAPTTSDKRLAQIAQRARGFIYAISRAGVTGERDEMTRDAEILVRRIRSVSDLPVAVGFGISTAEQVRAVWRFADAAVVGSAIVRQIEKSGNSQDLVKRIGDFARSLIQQV